MPKVNGKTVPADSVKFTMSDLLIDLKSVEYDKRPEKPGIVIDPRLPLKARELFASFRIGQLPGLKAIYVDAVDPGLAALDPGFAPEQACRIHLYTVLNVKDRDTGDSLNICGGTYFPWMTLKHLRDPRQFIWDQLHKVLVDAYSHEIAECLCNEDGAPFKDPHR